MNKPVLYGATIVELPFIFLLWLAGAAHLQDSPWFAALAIYHIVPFSIATFAWLMAFGHGAPPAGTSVLFNILYLLFIFFGQVLVTAAIASLFLTIRKRRRQIRTERLR